MAHPKSILLYRRFATLLSHERLWHLTRTTGFALRRRSFHAPTFVYACALLPNSTKRSLTDLRRLYNDHASPRKLQREEVDLGHWACKTTGAG